MCFVYHGPASELAKRGNIQWLTEATAFKPWSARGLTCISPVSVVTCAEFPG